MCVVSVCVVYECLCGCLFVCVCVSVCGECVVWYVCETCLVCVVSVW